MEGCTGAHLPNRAAQRVDPRHQQVRPTVKQVHCKEERSTRNPIAAIVRHVGSMPELRFRRNALRFSALRCCGEPSRPWGAAVPPNGNNKIAVIVSYPRVCSAMLIARVQEKGRYPMPRKRLRPSAGGDTPDAAARKLWCCIGTITTRILAVDLLQKQPVQSINSRLGCSVKPIGLADPVEEVKVGFENRLRSGFVRKRAPNG